MKMQGTQTSQNNLGRKKRGLTCSNFKTYDKGNSNQDSVVLALEQSFINQCNRIKHPEVKPNIQ